MDKRLKRGERIARTDRIINRRLKFLKRMDPEEWYDRAAAAPHRMAKMKPYDCGVAQCSICHPGKVFGIAKAKYRESGQNGQLVR